MTRRSRALAQAFAQAAGPVVGLCGACGGAPFPPRVRLSTDSVCPECSGRLDGDGRPILRFPGNAEGPRKLIVLPDDEEDEKLDRPPAP